MGKGRSHFGEVGRSLIGLVDEGRSFDFGFTILDFGRAFAEGMALAKRILVEKGRSLIW